MKQVLLFALALTMGAATANAGQQISFNHSQNQKQVMTEAQLPVQVKNFLKSEAGKGFTAQQFIDALRNQDAAVKAVAADGSAPTEIPFVNEGFSKMTLGSENEPDATPIADFTDLTETPGWDGFLCYQAGGNVYTGFDTEGEDGPGYLLTPAMDLSDANYSGAHRAMFRVRGANAATTEPKLQIFVLDNIDMKILSADSKDMNGQEWIDLTWDFTRGSGKENIMAFSWQGYVLFDSVSISYLDYGIETPTNVKGELVDGSTIKATWDAVSNADHYLVSLYRLQEGFVEGCTELETKDTQYTFENLALNFSTGGYKVVVKAANEVGATSPERYCDEILAPTETTAPVALEATDITADSFTAHWEPSTFADGYTVEAMTEMVAGADTLAVTLFEQDFSNMTFAEDGSGQVMMDNCNAFFNQSDWTCLFGLCWNHAFLIYNALAAAYGSEYASYLLSPAYDNLNLGENGTATIRVSFKGYVDPASLDGEEAYLIVGLTEGTNIIDYKALNVTTTAQDYQLDIAGFKNGNNIIFYDYDGASVALGNLKLEALLTEGQSANVVYATVEAEGLNANEAVVPFPYDMATYRVTAHVALDGASLTATSEEIPVIRGIDNLDGINFPAAPARRFFDLQGRRVNEARDGLFIMQDANGHTQKMLIK